jgi:hypothetical protein
MMTDPSPASPVARDADVLRAPGQEATMPAHITFVLEKRGEQRLIVQATTRSASWC